MLKYAARGTAFASNSLGLSCQLNRRFEVNLEARTAAKMAKPLQVDLWQYKTADGRSLRMAFEYLEPFAAGTKAWPFRQLKKIEPNSLAKIRQLRDEQEE